MRTKKPSNWLEQRLTILTEIRNNEPEKEWSVREVAEAMQLHPLVQKFQPTYGKSTAHRDIALIDKQLAQKREELAEAYIHTQLEITDELITDLMEEYEKLTLDSFEDNMPELIKAKVNITRAILAAQKRQASILPIDAPKKLTFEANHRIDIEHFYQLRDQAERILLDDPTVIEGEFHTD